MPTTLLLGSSGYIGGAVLVALTKVHPEVSFTALVRSDSNLEAISGTGATVIQDPLTDHNALAARVAEFDIVVNCASSSDVALTTAILQGFKKRFEQGKGVGALIHTSGAANFIDFNKEGKADPSAKVWTDSEEDIKQINTHLFHGNVDVPILKAGEEGYVNTFIVAPPGVFGRGNGPVGKAGLFMLGNYIRQGAVTYVGEGSNLCSTVHITDLVDLYALIFERALSAGGSLLPDSPYNRYYTPTAGELDVKTIASTYAKALHARDVFPSAEATQLSFEEAGPMAIAWSSNMLVKTVQTKSLGWEPKHKVTKEDVIDGLDDGLSRLQK